MTTHSHPPIARSTARSVLALRAACAALLLGFTVVHTGCVAVAAAGAAGAGVAWIRGSLETNLDRDLDRVYQATQKAVRGLEFAVVSERKSAVDSEVIARTALDKKVEIRLKQVGSGATHISIRIGIFGDEDLSLTILDRIKAGL
jgi:hypothetical protein